MSESPETIPFGTTGIHPKPKRGYCRHRDLSVDEDRRLLQCNTCEAWLDPFDWLFRMSGEADYLAKLVAHLEAEAGALRQTIAELKRESSNLTRRVKRAQS